MIMLKKRKTYKIKTLRVHYKDNPKLMPSIYFQNIRYRQ